MIKKIVVALVLATLGVTLATGADGSGCKSSNPAPAPRHTAARKPATPKPGGPEQGKPPIGNVRLTFWVGASHPVDVLYTIGTVHHTHSCDKSCHWDATAKPDQYVAVAVQHRNKRQEAQIDVQVVQANNGRLLCKDTNADRDPIDGVGCDGRVVI